MIKKYKIKNLKVEQKDIFDLKEKNKYDVIVATGVIHHTKNPKNTIIKLSEFGKDDYITSFLFKFVYLGGDLNRLEKEEYYFE